MPRQKCTLTAAILNFKMAACFHVKPVKFAKKISLKLVEVSSLTINICNYLTSHVDGHNIQDGRHFLRWPPFLYIKSGVLIKTPYNELSSDYCIKFKLFQV